MAIPAPAKLAVRLVLFLLVMGLAFGAATFGVPVGYYWWMQFQCWRGGPGSDACWWFDLLKHPDKPREGPGERRISQFILGETVRLFTPNRGAAFVHMKPRNLALAPIGRDLEAAHDAEGPTRRPPTLRDSAGRGVQGPFPYPVLNHMADVRFRYLCHRK